MRNLFLVNVTPGMHCINLKFLLINAILSAIYVHIDHIEACHTKRYVIKKTKD